MEARVQEALRSHFRPEFLNRLDETIIFHSLKQEELRQIVELQVQRYDPVKPVEMRVFLRKDNTTLSETWSYILPSAS